MVLGEIDKFPAFSINCIKVQVLCLAKMALESPTFAHMTSSPSMSTFTRVEPLQDALISESVKFFCIFSKTFGMDYAKGEFFISFS